MVHPKILIQALHVSEVGLGHSAPLPVLGVDLNIQLDVEGEGIGMAEVWERCWVLFIVWNRKWLIKEKGSGGNKSKRNKKTFRASMVTTQGEMEVPKFLAPKGPRGIYSHFWMSLADQSFMRTIPKMCLSASWAVMDSPMGGQSPPTKKAISSSKSIRRHGPNLGGSVSTGLFHQHILHYTYSFMTVKDEGSATWFVHLAVGLVCQKRQRKRLDHGSQPFISFDD